MVSAAGAAGSKELEQLVGRQGMRRSSTATAVHDAHYEPHIMRQLADIQELRRDEAISIPQVALSCLSLPKRTSLHQFK